MYFLRWVAMGATMLSLVACNSLGETPTSLHDRAMEAVEATETKLIAFRHDLHRFPELAGNEERTSGIIIAALSELGYDVRTNVGGYGVVGILEGASDGPFVAFRADMDAVAGEALDPVPYASQIDGVHHICGHDVHTAIGLGVAEGFAAIQSDLPGSVMLIFQPSEEAGTGADAMLRDGVFEQRSPDAIFAVHTAPFNVGEVATLPDGMMAGRTLITVSLVGDGDLAAATSALREALLAVGDVTPETMFSFRTEPFIFVDLLPQAPANGEAMVSGYVMSAGIEDRLRVEEKLRKAVASVSFENVNMSMTLKQALEGVNNDSELVDRTAASIKAHAPELAVLPAPGVIPAFSEDFGSFQKSVPGVMYFLGVNNPESGTVGFPHSPNYVADDSSVLVGIEAMLAAMLGVIGEK